MSRYRADDMVEGDESSENSVWGSDFSGRTRKSDCDVGTYESITSGRNSSVNEHFSMVSSEHSEGGAGGVGSGRSMSKTE